MVAHRGRQALRQRGFTLVELLVVITIIGMMMALILPAVNASREQGRQTQCKARIGDLALASFGYAQKSRGNRFPGYREKLGGNTVSWVILLLPLLEQKPVYDSWASPSGSKDKPALSILYCPSDPPLRSNTPELSYVVNTGMVGTSTNNPNDGVFLDRLASDKPKCTLDNFHDGITHTLVVSENIQARTWHTVRPQKYCSGFVWHNTTTPSKEIRINGNKRARRINANTARPSANHPGGVVVGFADGHVQFIRDRIDYKVYFQLMTPHGAESSHSSDDYKKYSLDDSDY